MGFSTPSPDLQQFKRLPLSIKLKRLLKAGKDLYHRRHYEEAIGVFEAMGDMDKNNLDALMWKKKCEEQLAREKNESVKSAIIKKYGRLKQKESGYENWTWGPTAGHFEVRYSTPKPHIVPPKKVRPRATDAQLEAAKKAAGQNTAQAFFDLAMLYNSRSSLDAGLDSLEKAAERDPAILANDDEGLTGKILEQADRNAEKGKITPKERLLVARVHLLQGDLAQAIMHYIKAASKDGALKPFARLGLKKIIDSGKTAFLQQPPEMNALYQAYIHENSEDRLYVFSNFAAKTPLYLFPFDFEVPQSSVKSVEVLSPDVLFTFIDPFVIDTVRVWVVGKDDSDDSRPLNLKAILRLDTKGMQDFSLSNYWVENSLPANWGLVFGPPESFGPGFATSHYDTDQNGIAIRCFQLPRNTGKGPTIFLSDFQKPLPGKADVWKVIDELHSGTP